MALKFDEAKRRLQVGIDNGLTQLGITVEQRMVERSPYKTGRLAGSLTYASATDSDAPRSPATAADAIQHDGSFNTVIVGSNVPYAPYVEYGTGPHEIRPRFKKALWWPGAKHPVMLVHHPGTVARPFMRGALDETRKDADKIMGAAVKEAIG